MKSCFGEALLLLDRLNPLPGGQESDEEQHQAQPGPEGHRHPPAVLAVVAGGELGHQRQREPADDELGDVHRDEAIGIELRAFVQIAGHHAAERRVGHVVHGVKRHEQHVGDRGIGDHRSQAPALGRRVGQDHDHSPGNGGPEHPGPEPAPARPGAVGEDAHDRVEEGVPQPRPQENGRGGAGAQAEHVRVEVHLEKDHRHEDEVGGGVAAAVARLFEEGEFLLEVFGHGAVHGRGYLATVKTTFCKSLVARGIADHDLELARLDDIFHVRYRKTPAIRA